MLTKISCVMLGCAFGGGARFYISTILAQKYGTLFPYGTMTVNILGCFLIGMISTVLNERTLGISPYISLLLTVGFLGGLTTFSSFSYDTLTLVRIGNLTGALFNVAVNTIGGFSAALLGIFLIRFI
ncbi:fluoride efflux transporter CrcB [Pectinatus sottacetonis]|uniref:fluoride efflux transporter CrcB n=1 Tax=Pectinatus sottacetonis TaxID=1002795 RepID=UPI001E2BAB5B|nr:fluoride efflux transporter CrcB [Pectinatus sottacetonis]